jgi:hypothetical protein
MNSGVNGSKINRPLSSTNRTLVPALIFKRRRIAAAMTNWPLEVTVEYSFFILAFTRNRIYEPDAANL